MSTTAHILLASAFAFSIQIAEAATIDFAAQIGETPTLADFSNAEVSFETDSFLAAVILIEPAFFFNGIPLTEPASFQATFSQPVTSISLDLFSFTEPGVILDISQLPLIETSLFNSEGSSQGGMSFQTSGGLLTTASATPFSVVQVAFTPGIFSFSDSETGQSVVNANLPLGLNSLSYVFATQPIPEPETYAMLLAGLGMVGFAARRRKANALFNPGGPAAT